MNRIRRARRPRARGPAHLTRVSHPHVDSTARNPRLAVRPGRDDLAGQFIQPAAEGAGVAVGQTRPAATTANPRRPTIPMPRLLPHTIQLCTHCRHNPAGFWVSRHGDPTVHRPWCLSCCQDLDPACHHIRPFDLQYLR